MGDRGLGDTRRDGGAGERRCPSGERKSLVRALVIAAALVLLLLLPSAASATVLPEKITENTTLSAAGNPYTAGSVTIESGVTLTINPGVHVIGSGTSSQLTVKGTLKAEGTAESPVTFTGPKEKEAGEWKGIKFEPGSGGSVLDHAEVADGGYQAVEGGIQINASSPTISNSTIRKNSGQGIKIPNGGSPEIANNKLFENGNPSTGWCHIQYTAPSGASGEINIHGNYAEKGGSGICVSVLSGSSVTDNALNGNTVVGTGGEGISYSGNDIPGDITENTVIGNTNNRISVSGTVAHSSTWNAGSPLWFSGAMEIASGVTLTINPGVNITASATTSQFIVKGTLKAEGTAESPVIFTGPKAKEAGEWKGIKFEPGSGSSVLNHVEVAFGGYQGTQGGVEVNASSPTIINSTIRKSSAQGIKVPNGGSPEIGNNKLFENGGSGSFWCNVQYTSPSGASGEVNIHGNYIEKGGTGICVNIPSGGSAFGKTLSGNTVVGTTGSGISYVGPDIPGDITENTLSGNVYNRIEITGTVAHSSTWNASGSGTPLWLGENMQLAAGVTLTVNPGVLIKSSSTYTQFIVKGTLKAEGTAEKPVVFTGAKEKEAGEWKGIKFEPGSGSSVLNYVEVSDAGFQATQGGVEVNASSPTIINSTIRKSSAQGIKVPNGGSPEIANNKLFENGGSGSFWCNVQYTSPSGASGEVNIHGNYIEKGGTGICVNIPSGGSAFGKTLSGNTVVGTTGSGISYVGPDIPGDITGNTLSGNTSNRIEVTGSVAHSSTWGPSGSPLWFAGNVEVASGVTLNVSPGALIQGGSGTSQFIVKGTLKAEGTAESPVIFTGPKAKEAGEWKGIKFEPGSGSSVLNHVEVAFGGYQGTQGGVEVNASSPTIINSTIRKSSAQGIKVPNGGSPEIGNNKLFENGGSGSFWCNVQYTSPSGASGEVNIHGNYIEKGGTGICVNIPSGGSAFGKTLSGNTVVGTTGSGISYVGPDIPGDITENTLSGNVYNRIEITGTVAHSSTWNASGSGTPLWLGENMQLAAGVTLTVNPGVLIKSSSTYTQFIVKGTLKAEGTVEKPVVFTGAKEKEAGEWKGIKFEPGSGSSVLNYVEVSDAGFQATQGGVEANASSPTIINSTIRKNSGQGIKVIASGAPRIEWNRFRSNGSGLSYAGTGNLSAPNNDWGCANGPKPAGCGDSVTSNVKWNPAVQLPELNAQCRGQESQCGEGADPVSLATGQLSYSHRDLLLTNKGSMPLEFVRAYSSGSSADTGLGPGWSQTGLASVTELESGAVLVLRQDGRQDLFYKTAEGTYQAPSGVTDTLAKVEGTFQLTTLERAVYRFDASGRIASITDNHGLKTTYAYNAEGRLATITDPSAQTLTFSYNASNHITLVKDSTGREVKYAILGSGRPRNGHRPSWRSDEICL